MHNVKHTDINPLFHVTMWISNIQMSTSACIEQKKMISRECFIINISNIYSEQNIQTYLSQYPHTSTWYSLACTEQKILEMSAKRKIVFIYETQSWRVTTRTSLKNVKRNSFQQKINSMKKKRCLLAFDKLAHAKVVKNVAASDHFAND